MINLSVRLKELRGPTSQADMAKSIGIPQQAWARYEKGLVAPNAETLYNICSVHAVSADWLLGLPQRGSTSTAIANGGVAITGSGNKIRGTIVTRDDGNANCAECKFKKFAEAFKAIQTPS